jgi:hypothetical protein
MPHDHHHHGADGLSPSGHPYREDNDAPRRSQTKLTRWMPAARPMGPPS